MHWVAALTECLEAKFEAATVSFQLCAVRHLALAIWVYTGHIVPASLRPRLAGAAIKQADALQTGALGLADTTMRAGKPALAMLLRVLKIDSAFDGLVDCESVQSHIDRYPVEADAGMAFMVRSVPGAPGWQVHGTRAVHIT